MNITINNNPFSVMEVNNLISLFKFYKKNQINSVYLFKNKNIYYSFFQKKEIDLLGIDHRNVIIYKYENVPNNKTIEILNDKKNTSILVLPKHTSKYLSINEVLSFEDKDIV